MTSLLYIHITTEFNPELRATARPNLRGENNNWFKNLDHFTFISLKGKTGQNTISCEVSSVAAQQFDNPAVAQSGK